MGTLYFSMEVINYDRFIDEIVLSQKFYYDCETLSSLSSLIIYDEIKVDDEDNFHEIFNELIFYFSSVACDDKEKFKQVIDTLNQLIKQRKKLESMDVYYSLNKEMIQKIVAKYKNNVIDKTILELQLKKYFQSDNLKGIYDYLESAKIKV